MKRLIQKFALSLVATILMILSYQNLFSQVSSGTYTIGGTTPNYLTVQAAVDTLVNQGLAGDGPVVFDIREGQYNGQITIGVIANTDPTNTITFQSENGDSTAVALMFNTTSSSANWVVRFNACSYVTFKQVTLYNYSTGSYTRVVDLNGTAQNNAIENSILLGKNGNISSSTEALIYSLNDDVDNFSITNSFLSQGSYPVYIDGNGTISTGVNISNNIIQSNRGIYLENVNSVVINNNVIDNSYAEGIYLRVCHNDIQLTNNDLFCSSTGSHTGIYLNDCDGNAINKGLIANNEITIDGSESSSGGTGIKLYISDQQQIYNNSVNIVGANANSYCFYIDRGDNIDVRNNNFVNQDLGYSIFLTANTPLVTNFTSNYNNLYTGGSFLVSKDGAGYKDLVEYQGTGNAANSTSYFPSFVSDTDLKPLTQWINGTGTISIQGVVGTDMNGTTRDGTNPDVGAHEFTHANSTMYSGTYGIGSGKDFTTIQEAIDSLVKLGVNGAVTLNIDNGNYTISKVVDEIPGTSAANRITFQSLSSDSSLVTLSYNSSSSTDNFIFKLRGVDYLTFKELTFANSGPSFARSIWIQGHAHDNTFSNCAFNGSGTSNTSDDRTIFFGWGHLFDNLTVQNSKFSQGSRHMSIGGIDATNDIYVDGIQILNNEFVGSYRNVNIGYAKNFTIHGNVMTDHVDVAMGVYRCETPYTISANKTYSSVSDDDAIYLIECVGASGATIKNNFLAIEHSTSSVFGITVENSQYQNIYNNSIYVIGNSSSNRGISIIGGSNIVLKNNIFNVEGNGVALYKATTNTGLISNYNDFSSTGTYLCHWDGTDYATIVDYQTASSQDANSVNVDPGYVSNSDLHTNSYWLDNKGESLLAVTEDIDGEARNTPPCIGADEYVSTLIPLEGTYTIGTGGDYATISDAVSELSTNGMSASVSFEIISGTYNEQFVIPQIYKQNVNDSIVFKSQSGNADDVIVTFESTGTGDNYIVMLAGTDDITFKNIRFEAGNSQYSRIIVLTGNIDGVVIDSCYFEGRATSTNLDADAVIIAKDNTPVVNNLTISNSAINNGAFGLYFVGNSGNYSDSIFVVNSTIDTWYKGVYTRYIQGIKILNNEISFNYEHGCGIHLRDTRNSTTDAIEILNNRFTSDVRSYYGTIYFENTDATGSKTSLIANNTIQSSTPGLAYSLGIYLKNSDYINLYHNSVNISGNAFGDVPLYTDGSNNIDMKNNSFAITGALTNPVAGWGYAINIVSGTNITSDYNNFYTPGRRLIIYQGTSYYSIGEYNLVSGTDANSISVFPGYEAFDQLNTNSYFLDAKGTPIVEVTEDINGDARDGVTPDIGAYEYSTGLMPLDLASYTVGSGGDIPTIDSLVKALMTLGISRSVTFDIIDAEYSDVNYILKDIPGASSTDTVIIQSQSRDASKVSLTFAQTQTDNYIFYLNGTDYITFRDLTFTSGGTSYSNILYVNGNSQHVNLIGNVFNGITTSSDSENLSTIILPTDNIIDHWYIFNNKFNYNSYGLSLHGYPSYTNQSIVIDSNSFVGQVKQIYLNEMSQGKISRNTMYGTKARAIDMHYSDGDFDILKNNIYSLNSGVYGIYMYYCDGSGVESILIANNMINTQGNHATYYYNCTYIDLYFNTIKFSGSNTGSALYVYNGSNFNVKNNNLTTYSDGYAYYSNNGSNILSSDYNNIFTTGARYAYFGTSIDTLPTWRTTSGMDANSLEVAPEYLAEDDLHLLNFSLMEQGSPIAGITDDIDGELRDATLPDIGADEIYARPPVAESKVICEGETTPTLIASGLNIKWYADAELNTLLISTDEYTPGVTDPGVYTYYVTQTISDDESDPTMVTLTINATPKIASVVTNIDCSGNDFGSINITVTDGTGPFFYRWSNEASSEDVTGLIPGEYTVTVEDIIGCTGTATNSITAPDSIKLSIITNDANCGETNGSATVTVEGGVQPYNYIWTTGDTVPVIDTLESGIYVVTVTDDGGCSESAIATVNDLGGAIITTDLISDVSCYGGNDGSIGVTITGGALPYSIEWSNGSTTEDITGLVAGPYEISVIGSDGCGAAKSISVGQPDAIRVGLGVFDAQCGNNNGSAISNPTGGLAPYSFEWSTSATTNEITDLGIGVYDVTVTDDNSCVAVKAFAVSEVGAPVVYVDSIHEGTCGNVDGAIYITAYGGISDVYTYAWSNAADTEDLTGVNPGEYSVTVTDTIGCSGATVAIIEADKPVVTPICIVTVDTLTNNNLVVWEKPLSTEIDYFNIYRESSQSGVYQLVGQTQYENESFYTDENSNAMQRSYRYKLTTVNNCAVESDLSDYHKTMHLTINKGIDDNINLIWDHYEGFEISTYFIYRKTASSGWVKYDSIASSFTSYTDFNPPADDLGYFIEIVHPFGCTSTKATNRNSSRSNVGTISNGSPQSILAEIKGFTLAEQLAEATIDSIGATVTITVVSGTNVTALTPTITVSEFASIYPESGVSQDFTNPVVYTVSAEAGNTKDWTVTVNVQSGGSDEAEITSFTLAEQTAAATINSTEGTIAITVVQSTDVTSLTPTIEVSTGASVNPASGVSQDFTNPVTYTVTAESGVTKAWVVTVTVASTSSDEAEISTFTLAEQVSEATINSTAGTVDILVVQGTSLTALSPTITVSAGASINPGTGVSQDFTNPVTYVVTAESGVTKNWTVTVTEASGSNEAEIVAFILAEQVTPATIVSNDATVLAVVAEGTSLTSLAPIISISADATINPASGVVQDFTNPVVYTVTAQSGVTKDWTVTVQEQSAALYDVTFNVMADGSPVGGAEVTFSASTEYTNSNGVVVFIDQSPGNNLPYSVTKSGFATYSGTIDIVDADVTENVTLTPVNVEQNIQNSLSIYPNPNTGKFYLKFTDSKVNDIEIRIYNTKGIIVSKQILENRSGEVIENIDINTKASGIYYMQIISGDFATYQRIVKQ